MGEIQAKIQRINEERGEIIQQRSASLWRRWRGEAKREARFVTLGEEWAALRESAKNVQPGLLTAIATVAKSEKAFRAAEVATKAVTADKAITPTRTLKAVARTRRALTAWPALVYCGPSFCHHVGERIENARKGLVNPWVTNIWGLPIKGPGREG